MIRFRIRKVGAELLPSHRIANLSRRDALGFLNQRKSCLGTLIRLWINGGESSLSIERQGRVRQRIDIPADRIEEVEQKFDAIKTADDFAAFVNAYAGS